MLPPRPHHSAKRPASPVRGSSDHFVAKSICPLRVGCMKKTEYNACSQSRPADLDIRTLGETVPVRAPLWIARCCSAADVSGPSMGVSVDQIGHFAEGGAGGCLLRRRRVCLRCCAEVWHEKSGDRRQS